MVRSSAKPAAYCSDKVNFKPVTQSFVVPQNNPPYRFTQLSRAVKYGDVSRVWKLYTALKTTGDLDKLSFRLARDIVLLLRDRHWRNNLGLMVEFLADLTMSQPPCADGKGYRRSLRYSPRQCVELYNIAFSLALQRLRFHTCVILWRQMFIQGLTPDIALYSNILALLRQHGYPDRHFRLFLILCGAPLPDRRSVNRSELIHRLNATNAYQAPDILLDLLIDSAKSFTAFPPDLLAIAVATCYDYNQLPQLAPLIQAFTSFHLRMSPLRSTSTATVFAPTSQFHSTILQALFHYVSAQLPNLDDHHVFIDALLDQLNHLLPTSLRIPGTIVARWKFVYFSNPDSIDSDKGTSPFDRNLLPPAGFDHRFPSPDGVQTALEFTQGWHWFQRVTQCGIVPGKPHLCHLVQITTLGRQWKAFRELWHYVRTHCIVLCPRLAAVFIHGAVLNQDRTLLKQMYRLTVTQSKPAFLFPNFVPALSSNHNPGGPPYPCLKAPFPPETYAQPLAQSPDFVLDRVGWFPQQRQLAYHPLVTNARLRDLLEAGLGTQARQYLERLVLMVILYKFDYANLVLQPIHSPTSASSRPIVHPVLPYNTESFRILLDGANTTEADDPAGQGFVDIMVDPCEYFIRRLAIHTHHPAAAPEQTPAGSHTVHSPQAREIHEALFWHRARDQPVIPLGFSLDYVYRAGHPPHVPFTDTFFDSLLRQGMQFGQPELVFEELLLYRRLARAGSHLSSTGSDPIPQASVETNTILNNEASREWLVFPTSPFTPDCFPLFRLSVERYQSLLHFAYRHNHSNLLISLVRFILQDTRLNGDVTLHNLMVYYYARRQPANYTVRLFRRLTKHGYQPDVQALTILLRAVLKPLIRELTFPDARYNPLRSHFRNQITQQAKLALKSLPDFFEAMQSLPRRTKSHNAEYVTSKLANLCNSSNPADSPPFDVTNMHWPLQSRDIVQLVRHYIRTSGVDVDLVLSTYLMDIFGKTGHYDHVLDIFNELVSRRTLQQEGSPDNTQSGHSIEDEKRRVSNDLIGSGDSGTLTPSATGKPVSPDSDLALDITFYNTMLNSFADLGHVEGAESVYRFFRKEQLQPDVVTYTTLAKAYSLGHKPERALQLWWQAWAIPESFDVSLFQLVERNSSSLDDSAHLSSPTTLDQAAQLLKPLMEAPMTTHPAFNYRSLLWLSQALEQLVRLHVEFVERMTHTLLRTPGIGKQATALEDQLPGRVLGPNTAVSTDQSMDAARESNSWDNAIADTERPMDFTPYTWQGDSFMTDVNHSFQNLALHDLLLRVQPLISPEDPRFTLDHVQGTGKHYAGLQLFHHWMRSLALYGDFDACEEMVDRVLPAVQLCPLKPTFDIVLRQLQHWTRVEHQLISYYAALNPTSDLSNVLQIYHDFHHHPTSTMTWEHEQYIVTMTGQPPWHLPWLTVGNKLSHLPLLPYHYTDIAHMVNQSVPKVQKEVQENLWSKGILGPLLDDQSLHHKLQDEFVFSLVPFHYLNKWRHWYQRYIRQWHHYPKQ
ncbi:hypothetical protein IWQ62_000815 [Dispira parvispora]|uniref:Uncharacterized protein n=1 Tax=Dispira parvispora TaxID=1520584 RepID=A0A9W8ATV4_9FUNG|nr:hypothetical protein IWQ62_000815 [Dispira parvispora]